MSEPQVFYGKSYWAKIYIAGSIEQIEQVCREFVQQGLCVNVKRNKYIYKYGEETGAEIELIQYPKYPADEQDILEKAAELAEILLDRLCAGSYTIMDKEKVLTYDRR